MKSTHNMLRSIALLALVSLASTAHALSITWDLTGTQGNLGHETTFESGGYVLGVSAFRLVRTSSFPFVETRNGNVRGSAGGLGVAGNGNGQVDNLGNRLGDLLTFILPTGFQAVSVALRGMRVNNDDGEPEQALIGGSSTEDGSGLITGLVGGNLVVDALRGNPNDYALDDNAFPYLHVGVDTRLNDTAFRVSSITAEIDRVPPKAAVPVPASLSLFALGLLGVGAVRRWRG